MKANGEIHLIDRATGKRVTHATIQCPHCALNFQYVAGSGRMLSFCTKCGQFTCRKPECQHCMDWRQKQDNLEGGLDINHRPVIVQGLDVGRLSTR